MTEETPKTPSEYEIRRVEEEASEEIEKIRPEIIPEIVPVEEEELAVGEIEVGESEVTGGIIPELELPQSADELRLVKRVLSRPIGLQVGFESTTFNATETGWYRFEFSEPFDEPPQVFVTIEHRGGEPMRVEYPRPSITVPRISRPSIGVPVRSFGTPLSNAKAYAKKMKDQARKTALALLGWSWGWMYDWIRGWFLAVYCSIVYFVTYAFVSFWNSTIGYVASAIRRVMADIKSIGDGINAVARRISDGMNSLAYQVQTGFNKTVAILKGYVDDSVTRSIANLYRFSDLPMMKLNVGVIRPPTTTYVDILGYRDSKIHVLAIGKRKRTLEDVIREEVEKQLGRIPPEARERMRKRGLFGLGILPVGEEE